MKWIDTVKCIKIQTVYGRHYLQKGYLMRHCMQNSQRALKTQQKESERTQLESG